MQAIGIERKAFLAICSIRKDTIREFREITGPLDWLSIVLIVSNLTLFEITISIDNAIGVLSSPVSWHFLLLWQHFHKVLLSHLDKL